MLKNSLKIYVSTIAILCATQAVAYVPYATNKAGQSGVKVGLGLRTGEEKAKGATEATKLSGMLLGAEYSYGIFDDLSFYGGINYISTKDSVGSSDLENTGMRGLDLGLRGSMDVGGKLLYGASLLISLADAEVETSTNKTKINGSVGGHELTPYVGWEMNAGSSTFGAIVSTSLNLSDKTVKFKPSNAKSTVTGGETNSLTAYYELGLGENTLGFSYQNRGVNATETKTEAGATSKGSTESYADIGVYGLIHAGGTEINPYLTYTKNNSSDLDSSSEMLLGVNAKFLF